MPVTLQDILDDAKERVDKTLLSTATIRRNGTIIATGAPCRIKDAKGRVRLHDTPSFQFMVRWEFFFAVGTDVKIQDRIDAFGNMYVVLQMLDPETFTIAVHAETAFMTLTSDGHLLPVEPNATVGFIDPQNPAADPITTEVRLFPLSSQDQQMGPGAGSTHGVLFAPDLPVKKDWQMRSTTLGTKSDGLNTVGRTAVLKYVQREYGSLAVNTGYYIEPA